MDKVSNMLGALALALADAQMRDIATAVGLGASASAALVTLGEYPGLSVAGLAGVVGLSHSATVRLVDDLVRRGLVTRGPGGDRRSVGLVLTAEAQRLRAEAMQARAAVLDRALEAVAPADRVALSRALPRILAAFTTGREAADHICRLCDEEACGREACPVERRAVALSS